MSPSGQTAVLASTDPYNPALTAEKSHSFTAGLDWNVFAPSGLDLSATYFDIHYHDRIAQPPIVGDVSSLLLPPNSNVLAPFINRQPSLTQVANVFATQTVLNQANVGPGDIGATFDWRLHNLSRTRTSGLDVAANYRLRAFIGELRAFLDGAYLIRNESQATPATAQVDLVNVIYNPMSVRIRSGLVWSKGIFSDGITVNYRGRYNNTLAVPTQSIASWTTLDFQGSVAIPLNGDSAFRGTSVIMDVTNLTDRSPPFVLSTIQGQNFGFDPLNATAMGRYVSLRVQKRW